MNLNIKSPDSIRTFIERAVSCLLFVCIAYSSTFDAVHGHGKALSVSRSSVSSSSDSQFDQVSEVPAHNRSEGQQCLICVLHRQFSSSILETPFQDLGPSTHAVVTSSANVFYHPIGFRSFRTSRHLGRAPPFYLA